MPEAFPYRAAIEDDIDAGGWIIVGADGERSMPQWLVDWDYTTPVTLRRRIEVDLEGMRIATGLPAASHVIAAATWRVARSELTGAIRSEAPACLSEGRGILELNVTLDGLDLGPALELETVLLLNAAAAPTPKPIAWRRASVLWRDKHKLTLMGNESQLPTAITDFAARGLPGSAPWTLSLGASLDAPAMGQIQLLINQRFEAVRAAATATIRNAADAAILSAMKVDVGRTLVERALSEDEVLDRDDWLEDSLGMVLRQSLLKARDAVGTRTDEPLDQLRELRDNDASAWAMYMAAAFGLFAEVDA